MVAVSRRRLRYYSELVPSTLRYFFVLIVLSRIGDIFAPISRHNSRAMRFGPLLSGFYVDVSQINCQVSLLSNTIQKRYNFVPTMPIFCDFI